MKAVLLLIHDDAGEEARLQAALDLTRAIGGHLNCLDVVQTPVLVGSGFLTSGAELALIEDLRAREAANRARTEARLADELVTWSWKDATGNIVELLKNESALADIIVLNTAFTTDKLTNMRTIVSEVVLLAAKPILAVPQTCHGLDTNGHALIAWNGSPAVAKTLREVTPLLALAASVTILEIGETGGLAAEEAAVYLSRHHVHSRIEHGEATDMSVDEFLLTACRNRQPAYCLMGAHGHWRLRETLFGGVTSRMVGESPVPLVLGH